MADVESIFGFYSDVAVSPVRFDCILAANLAHIFFINSEELIGSSLSRDFYESLDKVSILQTISSSSDSENELIEAL